ncbi:hypothetical protein Pelo_7101 [Pelomyxa schiedti]|nr:hypothetical protein Pelo_7101 [Pelomyxa schiedti]
MNFSLSEMTVTCGSHSTCPAVPFHIPKRPRQEILSLRPPLQTPHAPILSLPEMPPRLFSFHSRWPSPPQIVPPLYFPPVPPSPVRATNRRVPLTVIVAPPHMAQNNLPIPICTCVFGNEAKCPCSPLQHLSHKVDSSNPSSPAPMHFRSQSVCPVRVTPTALLSLRHQRRGNTTAPGTIPASHPPRLPVQPPALLVESIPIPPQPCNYNNPKVHAPISPECMRGLNPQPPLIKGTRPPLSIMIRPSKTTMELIPPPSQCENIRPPSSAMTVPLYTLVAPPPTKRFQVQVPENVELPEPKKIQQETVQVHSQELALQPKLHEVVNIKPTKLSAVHVEAVADDGNDDYAQFQASLHSTPKRRSREEKERALAETIPLESQLEVIQQLQQQQQKITQLQRRKSNMYNHLTSEQLKQEAVVQFHQLRKQQEERQRLHQQLLKDNRIRNKILKHKQRRQSSLKELLTDVENLPESVVQQPETGHASTEYVQQREQASFYKMLQSALSAQPPPRPDISAVFTSTNSNSTNSTSPTQPQTPRSQTPPPQVLKPQGYSTATVKAPPTTASASPPSTHLRNSSVVPPGSTNTENCMSCNKPVTASTPHKFIPGLNRRVHNDCILCVTCGIKIPSSFGMTEGKFYCTGCYSRRMQNTVCFVCHEPIPASSFAVNAEGKHCHSKCFCCSLCKAPFGDMSFTKLRDKFLCPSCHTKVITLLQSRQEHRL